MAGQKIAFNIPNIVNQYPQSASVISKLTKAEKTIKYNPADINFRDISISTKEKTKSNDDILELFPDVELAIQILTSSVLAPNDMVNIVLQYIPPTIALPSSVKQTLLDTISNYMDENYDITSKLQTILKEAMFTKGAYIEAIIPEASLDDIINQTNYNGLSLESFASDPRYSSHYLGSDNNKYYITTENRNPLTRSTFLNVNLPGKPSNPNKGTEITQEDLSIQITDNPKVLLYSRSLLKKIEKESNKFNSKALNFSTEAIVEEELDRLFKPDTKLLNRDYIYAKQAEDASRESIGSPLIIKLPTEAVIPVHATSDTSKHLGYFVVLDENGNPIDVKDGLLTYNEAMSNITFLNNSNASGLINKAKLALHGANKPVATLKELEPLYNDIVENMIKSRLRNGMFRELVDLNESADIYKVMLTRSLKAQQTKVLFLPSDLVAYYAFEYRDNGTGKSLLEKNLLLYSMRSMLLFARLMASIKNSITTTVVSATLDEQDPDPESSREKIISESLKTRQSTIPLGLIRPDDLTEWTHRVGFLYKISHPALPNIELDIQDQSPNKTIPDQELDDKLAERIYMSFGLTPEIVLSGYNSDFATTVAAKNLLFAKRCTTTQLVLMKHVTNHIRKIIKNDYILVDKLTEIIKTNIKEIKRVVSKSDAVEDDINLKKISDNNLIDYLVKQYVLNIQVELPSIVMIDASVSKAAFEEFKTNCDSLLDDAFNSTVFNEKFAGKLSTDIEMYKDVLKGIARIEWAMSNNFLPEVTGMLRRDDEGKPEVDSFGKYLTYKESMVELIEQFAKEASKSKEKTDKIMDKVEESMGGSSDGGGDYGAEGSEGGDEGASGEEGSDGGSEEGGMGSEAGGGDIGDNGDSDGDTDNSDDFGGMDFDDNSEGDNESDSGQNAPEENSEPSEEKESEPVEENKEEDKKEETNEEEQDKEDEDKKKEEEEKKKKEEEEKKKKDQQAEEAYQLDYARTKM